MTKVEAIKNLIEDNGGVASWQYIYDNIEKYQREIIYFLSPDFTGLII